MATEGRGARAARLEADVLAYLGDSGIYTTTELARSLEQKPDAVRRACRRLYERRALRLSSIPRFLYRFELTDEAAHRGNFPVISKLIAKAKAAIRQSKSLRARLPAIFAELRADPALRSASHQSHIERYERAARAIRSEAELRRRLSLRAFRTPVIHWWPRKLEDTYREPLRQVLSRLDRPRVRRLARSLPRVYHEGVELLSAAEIDAEAAEEVVTRAAEGFEQVQEQLADSGAQDLLVERDPELIKLAAPETLPEEELKVLPPEEIASSLDAAHVPLPLGMSREELKALIQEVVAGELAKDRRQAAGKERLRRWKDVAAGGIMIVSDIVYFFSPGTRAVIDSIVGTEVGVDLGVAVSVYSGWKRAYKALRGTSRTDGEPASAAV